MLEKKAITQTNNALTEAIVSIYLSTSNKLPFIRMLTLCRIQSNKKNVGTLHSFNNTHSQKNQSNIKSISFWYEHDFYEFLLVFELSVYSFFSRSLPQNDFKNV